MSSSKGTSQEIKEREQQAINKVLEQTKTSTQKAYGEGYCKPSNRKTRNEFSYENTSTGKRRTPPRR